MPLKIVMLDSVTIKGCILNFVIMKPLVKPMAVPKTMEPISAKAKLVLANANTTHLIFRCSSSQMVTSTVSVNISE